MKPWVLIDISFLAHRARYATADLAYDDFNTGILFGFWEQLRTICSDPNINSNKVVLFFDSRQSYRKRILPSYKGDRKKDMTDEEKEQLGIMYDQIKLLRRTILPAIGFQVIRQTGLESDDLIAEAANILTSNKEKGIIVSADGDLWQCISDYVRWYDPARRKGYDSDSFIEAKGIEPALWRDVKCIAGCSGDNVPGVPGVGVKTAIKFLTRQLPPHYKTYKAITSYDGETIISRNEKLVALPHLKTKTFELREPEYNPDAFFSMCERYGFLSYLRKPRRGEWISFFNTMRPKLRRRGE